MRCSCSIFKAGAGNFDKAVSHQYRCQRVIRLADTNRYCIFPNDGVSEGITDALHLARGQFALTAVFHILWPILTISLSAFLLIVEVLWVRTSDVVWYRHARFWSRLLILNFAVGVVSGIPMEFQFGTNWAGFSGFAGQFFGNILGFEGAMAFMLEAGFVGIMVPGWGRVPKGGHLLAPSLGAPGSLISAFRV